MRLVRSALVALLEHETDIKVVGELGWDREIAMVGARLRPDVVVINTELALRQTVDIVGELQAEVPGCSVLILADPRKPVLLPRGTHTRSLNFLIKDAPPELLADTIRRVAAGEWVIDPQIAVAAVKGGDSHLTTRELEVLELTAAGASIPEIADRLHLSLGTVRNYVSAIIAKTGARNRIDAILIAREAGWLP